MLLSKNFTLEEMIHSNMAKKLGIDNSLCPINDHLIIARLDVLCRYVLQPIRDSFGKPVIVSSGYRCPELNKAVGGSLKSQHMDGEAADIEISGVSNLELATYVKDMLDFDQLILENYTLGEPQSGWVHISWTNENRRREVRTIGPKVSGFGLPKPGA